MPQSGPRDSPRTDFRKAFIPAFKIAAATVMSSSTSIEMLSIVSVVNAPLSFARENKVRSGSLIFCREWQKREGQLFQAMS